MNSLSRSQVLALLAVFFASSGLAIGQTGANNHFGINGINFQGFEVHGNVFDTVLSPSEATASAALTSEFATNNRFEFTESNIDIPDLCSTPGACVADGGGYFESNSHRFWFSSDGGSTPHLFGEEEAFDISYDLTITTTDPLNRKIAGFSYTAGPQFNNNNNAFNVTTTTQNHGGLQPGLIGASGSPTYPNFSFSNSFPSARYTASDTINLRMIYLPPEREAGAELVTRGTIEYRIDRYDGMGELTSGPLELTLFEGNNGVVVDGGFLPQSQIGLNSQFIVGNSNDDSYTVTFENFRIVDPLAVVPGDYDGDGLVTPADYTVWRDNLGGTGPAGDGTGDDLLGTPDGDVDEFDYQYWQASFAGTLPGAANFANQTVPEPSTLVLVLLVVVGGSCSTRRRV